MKHVLKLSTIAVLAALAAPSYTQAAPSGPVELVDALEGVFGTQPGFRRSGAKGLCASGYFVANKDAASVSSASAFSGAQIPVVARFSIGGGNPKAPDKSKSARGLALQFNLPGGEQWLMANISSPVFSAATPESFMDFAIARKIDPATKKNDPAKIAASNAAHPDHMPQINWFANAGVPVSFGAVNYWGVHAFKFTNAAGQSQFAKWVFEPTTGQERFSDEVLAKAPDAFLNDDLRSRVAKGPVEFNFKLQFAGSGDDLTNPTIVWPESRKTMTVGRLVINQVSNDGEGSCDPINFNPLVLPKGIEGSDDPVLKARVGSYAVSQGRRLSKQ